MPFPERICRTGIFYEKLKRSLLARCCHFGLRLSLPQAHILVELLENGDMAMAALGEKLGLPRTSMHRYSGQLEKQGLIEKSRAGLDSRNALLHLSPAGEEAGARAASAFADWHEDVFAKLPEAEMANFTDTMEKLMALADNAELAAFFRRRDEKTARGKK